MFNNSKTIDSPQAGPYQHLSRIVQKHIDNAYQKPFRAHNLRAFEKLQQHLVNPAYEKYFLDSCCGTGLSSYRLAATHPDTFVIGVDQSAVRLDKNSEEFIQKPANCLLLQANCEDLWRLCIANNIRFDQHTIFYPNPYPKTEHFKRRWHGHPVFPVLKDLSSLLELRSNWRTYLDEFSLAWQQLTGTSNQVETFSSEQPLTLFERKYAASGQALYKLQLRSPT